MPVFPFVSAIAHSELKWNLSFFHFLNEGNISFQQKIIVSAIHIPANSAQFFFRGFMVHGTKHELGDYSVLFMVIPYCMIHFQKPFLETIGAIFAGIILGYISLRKGSIYTGIALHFSVAIIMDAFALYHLGFL